jgi:hypothetical protein
VTTANDVKNYQRLDERRFCGRDDTEVTPMAERAGQAHDDGPVPEDPRDAGVAEGDPDSAHAEAARMLAAQARETLRARGFTDEQIREWADAYEREEGSGDVDSFVAWIEEREGRR